VAQTGARPCLSIENCQDKNFSTVRVVADEGLFVEREKDTPETAATTSAYGE